MIILPIKPSLKQNAGIFMQNLTQIYSSPSYKPIIFTKNVFKSNLVQELKNIKNENNLEIPDFSNIKESLNSIIGGKYQIEKDTNLTINPDDFGFNEEDGDGYIKFTLSKSDTSNNKETSTTGLVYFERKQGNEVECHLAIDDKRSLNKESSLIDFFKNVFKKIFGDKTKIQLIDQKKELVEEKISNFFKNKMQDELEKNEKQLESIITKLTAENNNLKKFKENELESKEKLNTLISALKVERAELAEGVKFYQEFFNKKEILRKNRATIQADSNKELSKLSQRMNFLFEQFNNLKKSQEKTASSVVQSLTEKLSSNETLSDVEIQEKLDIASSICMNAIKKECSYILNEIKNITNQLVELNNNQKPIDQTTNLLNLKANLNILSAQIKEHSDNTEKHIIPLLKEKIQLNIKNAILLKELSSQVLNMGNVAADVDGMSSIKKLTAENEDLKTENKILLESQKSTETVAYTFMHENQILNNIIKNLDSQIEILRERNKKLIQEITTIMGNEDIQEVNEIVKCWRKSRE
ncbi:hypothetical protein, M protein repeats [Candidatus Hamiltonella defensa 5AT (Acyrthosiphon pisum)]|uniref:Uncharacterized protein n=2 Tax=Candidatus Williamhamiltonella defendens TaxID=138072 RepID=C4K7F3_HAMD5|nr:hypothetical protein, M protein repeats [Candidatus Hamiltonella defensa 5AT (Acyrthosiphon pisum)]